MQTYQKKSCPVKYLNCNFFATLFALVCMKTKTFVSLQQKTNDLTNDKTLASVSKFSLNIRYIDAIGGMTDSVFP